MPNFRSSSVQLFPSWIPSSMCLGFHPFVSSVPSPRLSKAAVYGILFQMTIIISGRLRSYLAYARALSRGRSSLSGTFTRGLPRCLGAYGPYVLVVGDLPSVRTMSYTQVMVMQRWRLSSQSLCAGKAFSRKGLSTGRGIRRGGEGRVLY